MTRVRWELVGADTLDAVEWDARVARALDGTIFQTIGWGEHRRRDGWRPERWVAREGGSVVGQLQALTRRVPLGVVVGWCPGGPVLGLGGSDADAIAERLVQLIGAQRGPRYLRFDSYLRTDPELVERFSRIVRRPRPRINTGVTTVLDLRLSPDELMARMDKKHRYSLRRAAELPIEWRRGCDIGLAAALSRLYAEMVAVKALRTRHTPDAAEIADLCAKLAPRASMLIGSLDGRDVVGCLFFALGGRAVLHMPVTGGERSVGLSYAMIDVLTRDLRAAGVRSLDLAGIGADARTRGVDRYKLGFGGDVVERLGEWEWASPRPLALAVSAAVTIRGPEVRA